VKQQQRWSLTPEKIRELSFTELRPGVEMHVLHEAQEGGRVAILRYAPGAEVPAHRHDGYEYIYVLEGEQSDERGSYSAGSYVINEPGVTHRVVSKHGCTVLIHWQRPVVFV
jgi:anti-sigma factor ChrR (cupin superfamily)